MAGGIGSAPAGGTGKGARRAQGSNRASLLHTVPVVSPKPTAQGLCPRKRPEPCWGLALFCFTGLERRVGSPGIVSSRWATPAARRRGCAARLFQRDGSALGQSDL